MMIETGTVPTLPADALFVIACPVCRGNIAATVSLGGRDACCPLCANLLRVPVLPIGVGVAAAPTPPALAEDWGQVIDTLTPSAAKNEPPPPPPAAPSDFKLTVELAPEPASEGSQEPAAPPPHASTAVIEPMPVEATPAAPAAPADSPTAWIDVVLESKEAPEGVELPNTPADFPHLGPAMLTPEEKDLDLREPVRTIRQGDTVIELRRLTPEERQARRFRRNVMMVVIGVSILLAIVVTFGMPEKPSRTPAPSADQLTE